MNDPAPVSHAKSEIPHWAPVSLHEQARELRKQFAITNNVLNKKLAHDTIHPAVAAAELQALQSAINTIEALEAIAGPDAALSAEELKRRLVLKPANDGG